jgi:hypothetical protein
MLKADIKESRKGKTIEQIKQQQQIINLVMKTISKDNPDISKKTLALCTTSIIRILNNRKSFGLFLEQQEDIRELITKYARELSLKS